MRLSTYKKNWDPRVLLYVQRDCVVKRTESKRYKIEGAHRKEKMFQYVPHIAISDICFSSDHTLLINTVSFILRVILSSLSIETTRRFLIMILCAINVGCVFKRSQNYTNACIFIWFYKNYTWVFDMYAALSILFISCSVSFIFSFHSLSMIFRYISFGWMSSCQYWAHHQVEFACAISTKLAINIEKRHECPSLSLQYIWIF